MAPSGVNTNREMAKSAGLQESEASLEASDRPAKQSTLFDLATVTQLKSASSPDTPKTAKTFRKISQRQRKQLEGMSFVMISYQFFRSDFS